MGIKTEVIYHSDLHPEIDVFVLPVCKGVWYVYLDWFEALAVDAFGGGEGYEGIYLSHPASKETDVEVKLYLPNGFLFGGQSKKSWHGTYYSQNFYEKMLDVS